MPNCFLKGYTQQCIDMVSICVQCGGFFFFFWLHHVACRILVPQPRMEPGPWQWKHRVLTTGPPWNSLYTSFEAYMFGLVQSGFPELCPSSTEGQSPLGTIERLMTHLRDRGASSVQRQGLFPVSLQQWQPHPTSHSSFFLLGLPSHPFLLLGAALFCVFGRTGFHRLSCRATGG